MTVTRVWADATATVIGALAAEYVDLDVVASVPPVRPDVFLLVRRTGGGQNRILDRARMVVEVWSGQAGGSTEPLDELSADVRESLALMPTTSPPVTRVDEHSLVFYPDPESGALRNLHTITAWLQPVTWEVTTSIDALRADVDELRADLDDLLSTITVIDGGTA